MGRIHLNRDRQNLGQFTPEQVAEGLASGRFLPTDLAWREGMDTWQPLSTFSDLPKVETTAESAPLADFSEPELKIGEPAAEGDFPWEQSSKLGVAGALWETLAHALGRPAQLFARLGENPSMGAAYRFYLLLALTTGAVTLVLTVFFMRWAAEALLQMPEMAKEPQTEAFVRAMKNTPVSSMVVNFLIGVPLAPVLAAGVYHAFLALFGGAKRSFATTFAVTCYVLGAVSPLQMLLCCGPLIQMVWAIVSLSIGLGAAHRTETWRSTTAVLVSLLIFCVIYGVWGLATSPSTLAPR